MIDEVHPFSRQQQRHVTEVKDLWRRLAPLLMAKRDLVGGMQWKTVGGHEYLYRYQPDPVTRKKRSTSVGRRSPETERLFVDFLQQRATVTRALDAIEPDIRVQARMSKALRLNRVPDDAADVLQALWLNELLDHVAMFGRHSTLVYELEFKQQLPLPPFGELHFVILGGESLHNVLPDLERTMLQVDRTYTCRLSTGAFVAERGPAVRFSSFAHLLAEMERDFCALPAQLDVLVDMAALEPVLDLPLGRSGNPVPMQVVDPRLYAALSFLRGDVDAEIGITVAELAAESGRYPFDDFALEAFQVLGKREDHGLRL